MRWMACACGFLKSSSESALFWQTVAEFAAGGARGLAAVGAAQHFPKSIPALMDRGDGQSHGDASLDKQCLPKLQA